MLEIALFRYHADVSDQCSLNYLQAAVKTDHTVSVTTKENRFFTPGSQQLQKVSVMHFLSLEFWSVLTNVN